MLTSRGLGVVLGDLAAMGFDAEWGVLGAHHTGAPHKRDRIWILGEDQPLADPHCKGLEGRGREELSERPREWPAWQSSPPPMEPRHGEWWSAEPAVGRVANGVASRMDRLKAIGNGQVPMVAALAFRLLQRRLESQNRSEVRAGLTR